MSKRVHSEIIYHVADGINIHSDTCPPNHSIDNLPDDIRQYYHDLLNEWLDKSKGTGIFYLREHGFRNYGNED